MTVKKASWALEIDHDSKCKYQLNQPMSVKQLWSTYAHSDFLSLPSKIHIHDGVAHVDFRFPSARKG